MSDGFHAPESVARPLFSPHLRHHDKHDKHDSVHANLSQLGLLGRKHRKLSPKKSVEFTSPAAYSNSTCSPHH
jgi:hypothetical protein